MTAWHSAKPTSAKSGKTKFTRTSPNAVHSVPHKPLVATSSNLRRAQCGSLSKSSFSVCGKPVSSAATSSSSPVLTARRGAKLSFAKSRKAKSTHTSPCAVHSVPHKSLVTTDSNLPRAQCGNVSDSNTRDPDYDPDNDSASNDSESSSSSLCKKPVNRSYSQPTLADGSSAKVCKQVGAEAKPHDRHSDPDFYVSDSVSESEGFLSREDLSYLIRDN